MSDTDAKDAGADRVRGRFVRLTLLESQGSRSLWISATHIQQLEASRHPAGQTLLYRTVRDGSLVCERVKEGVDEVLSLLERADGVRIEGLQQQAFAVGVSRVPNLLASLIAPSRPATPPPSPRGSRSQVPR